ECARPLRGRPRRPDTGRRPDPRSRGLSRAQARSRRMIGSGGSTSMSDCVFCKIVAGELPSKKGVETDRILAFHDINPKAPVHVLLVPQEHVVDLADGEPDPALLGEILALAAQVANQLGVSDYRVVINSG